jgi:hypothetical protein
VKLTTERNFTRVPNITTVFGNLVSLVLLGKMSRERQRPSENAFTDSLKMGETNLFSCFDDITVCLIVAFFPCYHGSLNKAKVDDRVRFHFHRLFWLYLLLLFDSLLRNAISVTVVAGVTMLVWFFRFSILFVMLD